MWSHGGRVAFFAVMIVGDTVEPLLRRSWPIHLVPYASI
jgi:hypothetical protein